MFLSVSWTPKESVQHTRSRVQRATQSLGHKHRMVDPWRVDTQLYERIIQSIFLPLQQQDQRNMYIPSHIKTHQRVKI
jgi:hypothetical protein